MSGPKQGLDEGRSSTPRHGRRGRAPEHIRFRLRRRRSSSALLRILLDMRCAGHHRGARVVLMLAASRSATPFGHASLGLLLVIIFVSEWFYYVLCETIWSGRTPGKMALQLRVVSEQGHPLRFWQSVLRNLLRAADYLPLIPVYGNFTLPTYAIGILVMGGNSRFLRIGDLLASTMVVVEKPTSSTVRAHRAAASSRSSPRCRIACPSKATIKRSSSCCAAASPRAGPRSSRLDCRAHLRRASA